MTTQFVGDFQPSFWSQINQLQIQIDHLQTQNASQSLVIKNLSNMVKLLHSDFQSIKQDNRILKRIIFELTGGDSRFLSTLKVDEHIEKLDSSSNSILRNESTNMTVNDVETKTFGDKDGDSQDLLKGNKFKTESMSNKYPSSEIRTNILSRNKENYTSQFNELIVNQSQKIHKSKDLNFNKTQHTDAKLPDLLSSDDDLDNPFDLFPQNDCIPSKSTQGKDSSGNLSFAKKMKDYSFSHFDEFIDSTFFNDQDSNSNKVNSQLNLNKSESKIDIQSGDIIPENNDTLRNGIDTSYAFSGTKIDDNTFIPSQSDSGKKLSMPKWIFIDKILGSPRDQTKDSVNSSFKESQNKNSENFPSFDNESKSEAIRSPFIHTKFEEFIKKKTKSKVEDETINTNFRSNLKTNSGDFIDSSPKTPRTPKQTQQAPNPFNSNFSVSGANSSIKINNLDKLSTSNQASTDSSQRTGNNYHAKAQSNSNLNSTFKESTTQEKYFKNLENEAHYQSKSQSNLHSHQNDSHNKESSNNLENNNENISTSRFNEKRSSSPSSSFKKYHYYSYNIDSDEEQNDCELNQEGKKLFSEARYGEAYAKFTECLLKNSENYKIKASIYFKRAYIALKMMKNFSLCLAESTKSIESNKRYYKSYLCRGDCYIALKEYDKAVNDFRMARNLKYSDLTRSRLRYAKRLYKESLERNETSNLETHDSKNNSSHKESKDYKSRFSKRSHSTSDSSQFSTLNQGKRQDTSNKENTDTTNSSHSKFSNQNIESEEKSFYDILEIPSHTTDSEIIKRAYKKLAKIWHPDRFINDDKGKIEAEEHFKEISKAYNILKDEKEKLKYDTILLRKRRKRSYSSFL